MNRRHFLVLVAALGLLVGCPPPDKGNGTGGNGGESSGGDGYRIAVAGPMTGSAAAFGAAIKKAAELAKEEINAAGGVKGKPLDIVIEDDKGDTNEATTIANKIAGDEDVLLVVGHFNSACSNAAKDTYNRKKVVEFSPGSTNIAVCKGSPYTFRNLYHDGYQGIFMARYVKEVLGHDKAAVVFDNDDYGSGLKEAIVEHAAKIGLEIVGEPQAFIRERTQDFKTLATTLKDLGPQTIMIAGLYNEAALLTKAVRNDMGWADVKILGADGVMDETFISAGGDAAEGAMVITPFFFSADASPAAKAFGEAYKKKYGGEEPNTWAALTYDAVKMAVKAIEEVGPDREKIQQWFAGIRDETKGYQGVTGVTFFDEHGDCPSKPAQVVEVRNGAYSLAEKQLTN